MIRMFEDHPVTGFTIWKRANDDFDAERRGMGGAGGTTILFTNRA